MVRSTMMNRLVQRGSYPRSKMLLLAGLLPYALLTGRAKLHGLKNDASHRRLKESPEPFDGEEAVQRLLDKLVVRKLIKNMVEGRRELQKRSLQQTSPTEGNTTSGDANESRSAKELPNEPTAATEHGEQEQEEAVGIESSFWEIYDALVFLIIIYLAGEASLLLGMPSLFGEIISGFLIGPPLADFVPFPESFVLIGEIGLIMLLLEAGIDIDVAQLKVSGVRAVLIAFAGAFGALAVGMAIAYGMGVKSWQAAMALGATFSPTSLAVASNALNAGNVLNTPVGQLIVAACVIDDVIGLVIMSMLEILVDTEAKMYQYFMPLVSAVVFLSCLGYFAIFLMPRFLNRLNSRLPETWHTPVSFAIMIILLMAYMPLMYISKASYLTGAFLAGLSYSQIPPIHHAFINYTTNLFAWLLRIFFAASIGFQVPITLYKDPRIVGWGFAFYAAVLAKLPLGLFSPKFNTNPAKGYPFDPYWRDVFMTGIAMTSRGEFSFIIASFASNSKLATNSQYAAVVWAVLLSCATSPYMLLMAIKYYNNLLGGLSDELEELEVPADRKVPLYLSIQARTGVIWGLRDVLNRCLSDLGLAMIDHRSWHPRGLNATVVTEIYVEDTRTLLTVPMPDEDIEKGAKKFVSTEHTQDESENGQTEKTKTTTSEASPINVQFDSQAQNKTVADRCEEVRQAILKALGDDAKGALLQVSEWHPSAFMRPRAKSLVEEEGEDAVKLSVKEQAHRQLQFKEMIDTNLDVTGTAAAHFRRHTKDVRGNLVRSSESGNFVSKLDEITEGVATTHPVVSGGYERPSTAATICGSFVAAQGAGGGTTAPDGSSGDLNSISRCRRTRQVSTPITSHQSMWETDVASQMAALQAANVQSLNNDVPFDTTGGPSYGVSRRRKMKSDLASMAELMPSIEERLGGFVRRELDGTRSPTRIPSFTNRKKQG